MAYAVEEVTVEGGPALAIRQTLPMAELPRFFGSAFQELSSVAHAAGAHIVSPPFARYYAIDPAKVDVEAVMPLDTRVKDSGRARATMLAKRPAVQVMHVGPYDELQPAYAAVQQWLASHHAKPGEPPREVYLTAPDAVPNPREWKTLVVQPLA